MPDTISQRIKRWKEKLIDLSKRNRLLNFRPTKVTTIKIVDELPPEIFNMFVTEQITMEFLSAEEDSNNREGDKFNNKSKVDATTKEFEEYSSENLDKKHTDRYLQTNLDKTTLQKNLLRIYSKATTVIEEQGYNALFLALGCLEWYESDSSDSKLKAPLVLIPVELVRRSVKGKFKIKYTEEPPIFNPALVQKLKIDFGININTEEDLTDSKIQNLFLSIKKAIGDYKRWAVVNDMYLSLFSFSKFIMYKDLDENKDTLANNTAIKLICGQAKGTNVSLGLLDEEGDLDSMLKASEVFQILDADSSQQRAILAAKKGKNLVIEGPPGTGKSQTIANIIAEFLAEKKKVLFVSQKMAALQVVKKRLDLNGLGDFCLELHSRKANKATVIKALHKTLTKGAKGDHSHDDELAKLDNLRKELNDYVKDLHAPFGKFNISPFKAFSIVSKHQPLPDLLFAFSDVQDWSKDNYNKAYDLLCKFISISQKIGNSVDHPWNNCNIKTILYSNKMKLKKRLDQTLENFSQTKKLLSILKKYTFFNNPATIEDIDLLVEVNSSIITYFYHLKNKFSFFYISYWFNLAKIRKFLKDSSINTKLKETIRYFSSAKKNKELNRFDIQLYKESNSKLDSVFDEIYDDISFLIKTVEIDEVKAFKESFYTCHFSEIAEKVKIMRDNIDLLDDWTRYNTIINDCTEAGLSEFLDKVKSSNVQLESIASIFRKLFFKSWLDAVFNERETLSKFYAEDHEKIIDQFCRLDRKQIELAKIRIQHKLSDKYDNQHTPSGSSELGLVLRESRKTRAHISLRKLFKSAPNIITDLKPCLMMSPLSVAQFLPPDLIKFDVVIFDEASQIPPEDSLGSILRSEQVIVAGDSQQLPPTTFFQSEVLTPEDENDEFVDALPEDLDSILDECAVSNISRTLLQWHYRSRHEELIAYSNRHFYDNRLLTFPCAYHKSDKLGIKFNFISDSHYDRGRSGTNVKEAYKVAEAVFEHYKNNPEISLGVGTFSIRQKYAIEDAVEQMLIKDSRFEYLFSKDNPEHFFVKNLETIQGDERDVIFISVGYGKDIQGRLTMNFGPINKIGGARRLNVLVTRARQRVEIFSSIKGNDFDLTKTDSKGVELFKNYLDFAEKGKAALSYDMCDDGVLESPFEEAVFEALIKKGFKVKKQVGCSGYRVDLALVDDENPGRFLLGIECDGASYHSSATTRDRDRLRQQVLENLGWCIYRVWSTDWFKNPRRAFAKLLLAIEEAKKGIYKKKLKIEDCFQINYNTLSKDKSRSIQIPISYQKIVVNKKFSAKGFYSYYSSYTIEKHLIEIIHHESPIHREEAAKRVIGYWGMKALGIRLKTRVFQIAKNCDSSKKFKIKGDFYWSNNMSIPKIRSRNIKGIDKDIEKICLEEIGEAGVYILSKEYGIPKDNLIIQISKVLGYSRVLENTSSRISEAIDSYIKKGKMVCNDNKIILGGIRPVSNK